MKWIGISGSWRYSSSELITDVKTEVTKALNDGNGIVTGGALGVDYIATGIALSLYPDGSRVRLFLPTPLNVYQQHYKNRAKEDVITERQAEDLIDQLNQVNRLGSLTVNNKLGVVDKDSYYLRNTEVINASDSLIAFQVNNSDGTQDTIDKAKLKKIPVSVHSYTV
jgi:hypothetical protein